VKDIATIEWTPANTPTRFVAKVLKAGEQIPHSVGTFTVEQYGNEKEAIDAAAAAVRAEAADVDFVLPSRFYEAVASSNSQRTTMYFDPNREAL
jgi:hypothetical protein